MRNVRVVSVIFAIVAALVVPASAVSVPSIAGTVAGIELCPQSVCGSAIFAGQFTGQIKNRPAQGAFYTSITHEALPDPGLTSAITGGTWQITTRNRTFAGVVSDGTLFNNGNNTYTVTLTMVLTQGGTGTMTFTGLLNHNVFPPTITGYIAQ